MPLLHVRRLSGFTLAEALVFLFIFSIITLIFFQTFARGTALIVQAKNRLGAIAVANQKMEIVRSLDYSNIGTTTGIPSGSLLQDENLQINNSLFHVHIFVEYIDDVYDGTFSGSPSDVVPDDYKRVKIEVTWGAATDAEKVAVVSNFSPTGVEQAVGGGILSINILNSQGVGVPGATVTIVNSTVAPSVNITTATDSTGNIFLIGAPASTQKYQITFSKGNYYGNHTYAPFPITSFTPVDIHASVVNNVVNQASYIMDQVSTLNLLTVDPFDANGTIPNINYRIDGGRKIGTVTGSNPAQPVYDFGEDNHTDASGAKNYTNTMSYGTYQWSLAASQAGYTFIALQPTLATGPNDIDLSPSATQQVKMVLADNTVNAALITVVQASDNSPVSGASVHLTNAAPPYDTTVTTSLFGKAYFPTVLPPLTAGTYTIQVTAPGFQTKNDTIVISSGLAQKTEALSP